jgi:dimethylargininase
MPLRVFDFNQAIVRKPARSVVEGLRAVNAGSPSHEGVTSEQSAYINALQAAGVAVEVLAALEEFPDSIFVEDAALVFADAAIVLRPGAASRRGEADAIAPVLARRFERVLRLTEGSVDGGDVLTTAGKVFIGQSERTNGEGARALTALLAQIALRGEPVATPAGVLHFKSDCSLLDEETILATGRLAASGVFEGFRVVMSPPGEEGAANAVRVCDRVLMSDGFPRTAEMLDKLGYKPTPLATREIAKIDAGLSCMSLRWRGR